MYNNNNNWFNEEYADVRIMAKWDKVFFLF